MLYESPITLSTPSSWPQTDSAGGQIIELALFAPAGTMKACVAGHQQSKRFVLC